jgi:hypothetical protein
MRTLSRPWQAELSAMPRVWGRLLFSAVVDSVVEDVDGSPRRLRVAISTAIVHVGARSTIGMSSAARAGRKTQFHPTSRIMVIPTATSSAIVGHGSSATDEERH